MKRLLPTLVLLLVLLTACGGQSHDTEVTPAPDFDLPNALGGNVSLNNYSGKNVLLFFHMAVG